MERTEIRHGELVLIPVEGIDMTDAVTVENYIAGHSETGHYHVIDGDCAVLERPERDTVIALDRPAKIVHKKATERHADIAVPAGQWMILRKTEYDPFAKARREVWD